MATPLISIEALAEQHRAQMEELQELRAQLTELKATQRHRRRWIFGAVLLFGTGAYAQLVTFNPNTPAMASQVNANFTQLKTWLEQKVGTAGTGNITIAGTTSITGATTINGAATVTGTLSPGPITPPYSAFTPVGAGGAAICNDNTGFKALMLVGNNSAGGNRKVQLYDDVLVNGDFQSNGNSWGGGPTAVTAQNRTSCTGATTSRCPNGQFVCGIQFNHACGVNWWEETVDVECCNL